MNFYYMFIIQGDGMYLTKNSLSYFFLCIGIIAIIFYAYFKFITIKTSPNGNDKDKIVGEMKDIESWRYRNIVMGYLSLFWGIISILAFIFLKFYYKAGLLSILLPFIYFALIVISIVLFFLW